MWGSVNYKQVMNKREIFELYHEIQECKKDLLFEMTPDLRYIENLVQKNYFKHYQQHLRLKKKILDKSKDGA